jgi:hypothetical protein
VGQLHALFDTEFPLIPYLPTFEFGNTHCKETGVEEGVSVASGFQKVGFQ